jgi:hypothetical protein
LTDTLACRNGVAHEKNRRDQSQCEATDNRV